MSFDIDMEKDSEEVEEVSEDEMIQCANKLVELESGSLLEKALKIGGPSRIVETILMKYIEILDIQSIDSQVTEKKETEPISGLFAVDNSTIVRVHRPTGDLYVEKNEETAKETHDSYPVSLPIPVTIIEDLLRSEDSIELKLKFMKSLLAAYPMIVKRTDRKGKPLIDLWVKKIESNPNQVHDVILFFLRSKYLEVNELGLEILLRSGTPIKYVNLWFKVDSTTQSDCEFTSMLRSRIKNQGDTFLLPFLLRVCAFLGKCKRRYLVESADLQDAITTKIEEALAQLFVSDVLDDNTNCLALLLNKSTEELKPGHQQQAIYQLQLYEKDGTMTYCIRHRIMSVFGRPQVARFVDEAFFSNWKALTDDNKYLNFISSLLSDFPFALRIVYMAIFPRFCPAAVVVLHLFSRSLLLTFIGVVSVSDYGSKYQLEYQNVRNADPFSTAEVILSILFLAQFLHEIGCIIEKFGDFFTDEWAIVYAVGYVMGVVWFILRLDPSTFGTARVILAMTAIPEAIGLLRYLIFIKSLGELVVMLRAMLKQIGAFVVLYLICITGFGILFRGLFYGSSSFVSNSSTFLNLVSFTLGPSIDVTMFDTDSSWVNNLGIVSNVLFEVMTAILLVNLLIALMTNSFQEVSSNALNEWYFVRAKSLREHKLLCEKNVLNMLPAPLNIITILVAPLHYYFLNQPNTSKEGRLSFAGTVANFTMFLAISAFRLPILAVFLLRRFVFLCLSVKSFAAYKKRFIMVIQVFKLGYKFPLVTSMIDRLSHQSGTFKDAKVVLDEQLAENKSLPRGHTSVRKLFLDEDLERIFKVLNGRKETTEENTKLAAQLKQHEIMLQKLLEKLENYSNPNRLEI